MEQFEQLLTCCVCLDRYRNPKLLPCQHSFCMEPCMEGLVDYVRRQVKCPECRAEHRIPYQGVQAFPTNVTLQRFLELHIEITGELPDPTSGQIMERCNVCSEKAYLSPCAHCDKKICEDCKSAHMDILRREISRINSQIRRGVNRLQDSLSIVEKNTLSLQTNCLSVSEEIEEIYRRLNKALKDRTEHLRGEIDRYLGVELRNLTALKDNLDLEISNIQSNCDVADKFVNESIEWDDCELMDTKEIFLKTVEFMRNFEYENTDYNRRVRFLMSIDPNQLVMNVATFGDLNITPHPSTGVQTGSSSLQPPPGPGLMRSKSDHRLATQFRAQQEDRGLRDDDDPVLGGRKFGERYARTRHGDATSSGGGSSDSRYGRTGGNDYDYGGGGGGGNDYENDQSSSRTGKGRFRSRFVRSHQTDDNSDNEQSRNVRFHEKEGKERDRVIDTEDVARGHLSGIIRLTDSPRVMKRIQEQDRVKKEKKDPQPVAKPVVQKKSVTGAPPAAARQISEDEIDRAKKQNKGASSSAAANNTVSAIAETERPPAVRVAALKSRTGGGGGATSEDSDSSHHSSGTHRTPPQQVEADDIVDIEDSSNQQQTSKTTGSSATQHKKTTRSASSDSSTSSESSTSSSGGVRNTGAAYTTEEVKQKLTQQVKAPEAATTTAATTASTTNGVATVRKRPTATTDTAPSGSSTSTTVGQPEKKPFQSRFLPQHNTQKDKKDDTSSEEETSSEESDDDDDDDETPATATTTSAGASSSTTTAAKKPLVKSPPKDSALKTDIGPLLARSSQARETNADNRRNSREETTMRSGATSTGGYSSPTSYGRSYDRDESPKYSSSSTTGSSVRRRPTTTDNDDSRYGNSSSLASGSGTSGYTSRFLNKSKSTAVVPPPPEDDNTGDDSDSKYGTGRTRYLALKERRNRLAKSRSTHTFGNDDDDIDEPVSPTTASPNAYLASRYGPSSSLTSGSDLSRSRSSHALKSARDSSPIRSSASTASSSTATADADKDGAALSSWARYLKNKYGNRSSKDGRDSTTIGPPPPSASSSSGAGSSRSTTDTSRRLSLGLPLRQANEITSSDDDSKNGLGSPTSPTAAAVGITGAAGISPRTQYLQKRRQLFQLGGRGSEPGCFTWPRGISVGPDNSIVVADSSNHRVQVFDANGIFSKEFGTYGNSVGEFDCLAGVAVNRIGQYIIADRYNHRIQVMDPAGRFLRAFGSQGTADGKFNYPWGVTTDALGFIYVCDKENHRVQVFQSDGTFVGKFGVCGKEEGQLEHPHYIAVSNTNRVIVSDSNNHRIQIFDVNGRVLTAFGTEGSEEGQFKFPRGVAVDDQGYICVADSGNNRIQIFHPDGSFLRAFGSWGSGDAEFKGLEGVAIMSNGNILVCDRENHRVQVF